MVTARGEEESIERYFSADSIPPFPLNLNWPSPDSTGAIDVATSHIYTGNALIVGITMTMSTRN